MVKTSCNNVDDKDFVNWANALVLKTQSIEAIKGLFFDEQKKYKRKK